MIKYQVHNQQGDKLKEIELSDKVFGVTAKPALLHQAVMSQLANQRPVLADTLGRSEVRGGGKKPWRQKGTGRARAGSSRSPIWRGGGVTFGPTSDRNFKVKLNDKMKRKALLAALSERVASQQVILLDKLELAAIKTKDFNACLKKLVPEIKKSILVINDANDDKIRFSARNLPGVATLNLNNLNIVEIMQYRHLILTEAAVAYLEKTYSK